MLNHIVLMGRLTRDPDFKKTQGGVPVTDFSIACERDGINAQGKKDVDFVDVVCWQSLAEFTKRFLSKGRKIVVSGRLQIREYTSTDGVRHKNAEIVADNVYFADSKPASDSNAAQTG